VRLLVDNCFSRRFANHLRGPQLEAGAVVVANPQRMRIRFEEEDE